jgi:hypothetical protein
LYFWKYSSYAHPEEIRTLYLQALDSLIEDGSTELVLTNYYLDLFELKQATFLARAVRTNAVWQS